MAAEREHDKQFEKRKKLICELMDDALYVPMKEKELAVFLQVSAEERDEFRAVLQALLAEGRIEVTKRGRYIGSHGGRQLTGTFISHAKGFGFVEVEGREDDLYVPEGRTGGAFHMDRVQVALLPGQRGKRQEAAVVRILEHGTKTLVGTYDNAGNFGFVIPDNTKIGTDVFVPKERSMGASADIK